MYPNNYTPEEKLERIKLFMKYDSSKTLNENRTIVEQADISGDIRDIKDEITSFNSDESETIKIIQKYKSKADFDKFLKAYQEKYNIDFGTSVYQILNPYNDPKESKQLQDHLATLGITATSQSTNDGRGTFKWEFSSEETAPTDTTPSKETQKATQNKISQPAELKDVKAFQDWLDKNKPGWADGYKDGILNKGAANQGFKSGGYGTFGRRTKKAWENYKDEYLKNPTVSTDPDLEIEDDNNASTDQAF